MTCNRRPSFEIDLWGRGEWGRVCFYTKKSRVCKHFYSSHFSVCLANKYLSYTKKKKKKLLYPKPEDSRVKCKSWATAPSGIPNCKYSSAHSNPFCILMHSKGTHISQQTQINYSSKKSRARLSFKLQAIILVIIFSVSNTHQLSSLSY